MPPGFSYASRPWLASYPTGVPSDVEVPQVPLTGLLDDAALTHPTTPALAFLGTRITYRELKDAVDAFATALTGLGVARGDRVAIVLPNCPQHVITFFAVLRLGGVVVAGNPGGTEPELRHQLRDAGVKVVVCLDKTYRTVAAARRDTDVEHVVVTSIIDYLPTLKRVALRLPLPAARHRREDVSAPVPQGAPVRAFLALLKSATGPARQVELDPAVDLALLHYPAGRTDDAAKGVMLTHANLVANAHQSRSWLPGAVPGREVVLAVLPLSEPYGLTACLTTGVLLAATLVLLPRFDLDLTFGAIEEFAPTLFPGLPPIYVALTQSPKVRRHDLRSIKVGVSSCLSGSDEVREAFERISGGRLVEGYGRIEASPATHANPVSSARKLGSIGVPLPSTQCRIVAAADPSQQVPPGEPGELTIRGPQVFVGYWNSPVDTAAVLTDDGWLHTGDIAVMDRDGFFTVIDRKDELIVVRGHAVYPSEVEDVLSRHPAVADCAVAGVSNGRRGTMVMAYVVCTPGATLSAAQVIEHCATSLAARQVPVQVEFRDSLPRTPAGTLVRHRLLEQTAATAGRTPDRRLTPSPSPRPAPGRATRAVQRGREQAVAPGRAEARSPHGERVTTQPVTTERVTTRTGKPVAKKVRTTRAAVAKPPVAKVPAAKTATAGKTASRQAATPATTKAAPSREGASKRARPAPARRTK